MGTPALFQVLVRERRWQQYEVFKPRYEAAARELAEREGPSSLSHASISKRQFMRWLAGDVTGLPDTDARRILERLFQVPAASLSEPMPGPGGRGSDEARSVGSTECLKADASAQI